MKNFLKLFVVNFTFACICSILGLITLFGATLIIPEHISHYDSTEAYLRIGGSAIFVTIMMSIAVSVIQKFSVIEDRLKKFVKYEGD